MVQIRPIGGADVEPLHRINESNVPEVGPADIDHLRFLITESSIALAVELDERTVGFALVLGPGSTYDSVNYRWFMDRFDDALYLDRVAFTVDARGRGFGTQLYAEIERRIGVEQPWARRLTLEVNVEPRNEPSLAFHARRGFVEVGQQSTPKGVRVSLMQKVLAPPSD